MSDPLSMSRTARESLARGLNALQADPSVPAHLVELAAPIAQAMGALHQLERTNQLMPHADVALNHVRGALARLQAAPTEHPAVNAALESVAKSLSLVHSLSRAANDPPPARAPGGSAAAVGVARDPFAARAPVANAPPDGVGGKPATPSVPVPAPPANGDMQVIAADLGAHSPTNFYKGLSGNDIIDHGGLFVSTYVAPKIGTPIRLKVSLPGGYEFEANAVVKWTRELGGDAAPGFGAQFTAITPEARQLVYRYVRNREPIFHDDL